MNEVEWLCQQQARRAHDGCCSRHGGLRTGAVRVVSRTPAIFHGCRAQVKVRSKKAVTLESPPEIYVLYPFGIYEWTVASTLKVF